MTEPIRSRKNERLRWAARVVRDRRFRRREGVWAAEGVRLAEEVAGSGLPVRLWLLEEGWGAEPGRNRRLLEAVTERGDPVVRVARGLLREAADTQTPQGVAVVFQAPRWAPEDLLARSGPLVVLDRLQDPGNLGTLARTAEATGAAGLVLVPGSADPGNPKALRASAGSLLRLPALTVPDAAGFLKAAGIQALATVPQGGAAPDELDLAGRFALLLGQEGGGLAPDLAGSAALRVTLPMEGRVESLNVAAAAAMILYEAQRQRRKALSPISRSAPWPRSRP